MGPFEIFVSVYLMGVLVASGVAAAFGLGLAVAHVSADLDRVFRGDDSNRHAHRSQKGEAG